MVRSMSLPTIVLDSKVVRVVALVLGCLVQPSSVTAQVGFQIRGKGLGAGQPLQVGLTDTVEASLTIVNTAGGTVPRIQGFQMAVTADPAVLDFQSGTWRGTALETASLRQENRALRNRLAGASGFGSMLGKSERMRRVFDTIEKVAETDVTVLIRGDSGTGKELVAREVHRRTSHRTGEFIAMNCAAMPTELIESELFGHEKGSFTGASAQRKGKFEAAISSAKKDLESNDPARMKSGLENLQKVGAELYQQAQAAQAAAGGAQPDASTTEAGPSAEPKAAKKAEGKVVDADVEIVDDEKK